MEKERIIIFSDFIEIDPIRKAMEKIIEINRIDDEKEQKEVGYKREPIKFVINSYGGNVYDGFALMALMETSKTPVHTYCYGYAMSMGLSIFLAGVKRFAHPLVTFMYHQISTGAYYDKIKEIKQGLEQSCRLERMYDEFMLKRTNILKEKLDAVKEAKDDWFFGLDEAKKLGVVHEVIE